MDTLWREVDLQSVESFILFSRALDPGFSYIEGPSSSVRTTLYHTNERSVDGADHSNRQQDSMDEDEDEGSKVDSDQEDHENEMSGDMDDLHQQQQQQQPQQQGSFRSVYCGQGGRRPRRTGRLSLSSTTSSESDASTTSTLSSCSSSSSTNTSPYSMSSQAFSGTPFLVIWHACPIAVMFCCSIQGRQKGVGEEQVQGPKRGDV